VYKLANVFESADFLELEQLAMETLASADLGLNLPLHVRTKKGMIESVSSVLRGEPTIQGRLLEFIDGKTWFEARAVKEGQRLDLGRRLAQITSVLATVNHPAIQRSHRWDLTKASVLHKNVKLVKSASRRTLLEQTFLRYNAGALPFLDALPHSLIHNDLNDENLLVTKGRVSGILDFGDCLSNPTICELAIALAYVLLDEPDPFTAGAQIITSYHELRPLQVGELEVLFPLICGRLAVSLTVAAERRLIDPDRSDWFVHEGRAWKALEYYMTVDPLTAARQLASGTDLNVFSDHSGDILHEELLKQWQFHFSNALSLSYDEPLTFVRGNAQFLYDDRQRPYLDLYNNVCHVGHCHPRVAAAGYEQMQRLNTNTRYLYHGLTEYAQRLCKTLPSDLQFCFFVNSGTEANELALRLAQVHTGQKDLLVMDGAYHGHTTTMIDISPYKFMGKGGSGHPKEWVHMVPIPDGYRGPFKGQDREAGVVYGNEVGRIVSSIERPIAGFIAESLPSCGGQIIPPVGYLETAFRHVRAVGGVCIVDEVHVGFGRVGTHFWGFELQDVVPDIVVMGKPIGNGHPMAAVVTTPEIADSFAASGMEFFATFGGNPVSCAIGMAVLDVIRDENLQEHALNVGTLLKDGLRGIMDKHSLIGDVRGVGLFIGVELVRNHKTLEPATEEATALINGLRQRGVLTSTDGLYGNVIKIKPPLVITKTDAEMAIAIFDDALSQV
jgi:4-aminobutyrate aminotransferase-like enzyme/Ser/Thr protein kinase RdoA (MazF antagonist)